MLRIWLRRCQTPNELKTRTLYWEMHANQPIVASDQDILEANEISQARPDWT